MIVPARCNYDGQTNTADTQIFAIFCLIFKENNQQRTNRSRTNRSRMTFSQQTNSCRKDVFEAITHSNIKQSPS
ncbi:hypothetical protein Y032_0053g2330 [Ancylostoma ceylanicum]|uniref:Uncharacterized protein n=1 Tax=Ancylostoma ceylanicum TaxID=53326 RepID=A0A016U6P6_9BILA|nr:hypothetical protein Y032_0053g2330 [Ancylostoma ceylanicum]